MARTTPTPRIPAPGGEPLPSTPSVLDQAADVLARASTSTPARPPGDTTPDPTTQRPKTPPKDTKKNPKTAEDKGPSQASKLVDLARKSYRFVQGSDGKTYAVDRHGPAVALPLRGRDGLRQRLARTYYAHTGAAPGGSALSDALTVIEGIAMDTTPVPINLRVAPHGNCIVVDLGDPTGRAVVISPGHWDLTEVSPVLFRRTTLTGSLPVPETTGPRGTAALQGLRALMNVDDDGFGLIVAWLIASLFPSIPHPVLALLGEQGTAKSTAAEFCVRLIDPSPAPLRTPPKDIRSWAVTAAASWTVALDNVSAIAPWFSDTLCKAVTGDGVVDRANYTDDDVTVLSFRRVIVLTSIDAGNLAGDLAERMIPIELHRLDAAQRRTDAEVQHAFTRTAPLALTGLLDLTAEVLAVLPTIRLDELPRMADFARILATLDEITGWNTLATYTERASENNHAVVDADPFATAIVALVHDQAVGWTGTAADLLDTLNPDPIPRIWPKSPRAAAGHLRRIAPALRASGVAIETSKSNGHRLIHLALNDTAERRDPNQQALPALPTLTPT